jgi:hypothetical protein
MDGWIVDPNSPHTAEWMICHLAGVCNGASTWDGAGFSKVDAAFGHSLAERAMASRPWTIKQSIAALKLIRKYQRQLGGKEFIDNWMARPVFRYEPIDPANKPASSGSTGQTNRILSSKDNIAVFRFPYDNDIVQTIKAKLKGEHRGKKFWPSWDPSSKAWTLPVNESSIIAIMEVAREFSFDIEQRFKDYEEKIREKIEEDRAMLILNGGRNIVLAGDEIVISVDNAAIMEEFEKNLGKG